jgi:hypothetical protein
MLQYITKNVNFHSTRTQFEKKEFLDLSSFRLESYSLHGASHTQKKPRLSQSSSSSTISTSIPNDDDHREKPTTASNSTCTNEYNNYISRLGFDTTSVPNDDDCRNRPRAISQTRITTTPNVSVTAVIAIVSIPIFAHQRPIMEIVKRRRTQPTRYVECHPSMTRIGCRFSRNARGPSWASSLRYTFSKRCVAARCAAERPISVDR